VLDVWRRWAPSTHGRALDCGHYPAEERPTETLAALRELLSAARPG
jgi:haloacetate dehalogenase